jgi:hypothetical protein
MLRLKHSLQVRKNPCSTTFPVDFAAKRTMSVKLQAVRRGHVVIPINGICCYHVDDVRISGAALRIATGVTDPAA